MYLKKKSFYEKIVYNILLLLIITITSCNDSTECSDCGEVIDGFLFKKVTQDDFVNFSDTDFNKETNFKYTKFPKGVSFENSVFSASSNFKYTEFTNPLNFEGTIFKGETNFKNTTLDGEKFTNHNSQ